MCKPKVGRKEEGRKDFPILKRNRGRTRVLLLRGLTRRLLVVVDGGYCWAAPPERRANLRRLKSASSLRECVVVDFENDELVLSSFSLQTLLLLLLLLLPTLPKFSDG